jgi:rhodanese-related sulfurtransferase
MDAATPQDPLPLEIDVQAVAALQQQEADFLLLDVREPEEYATAKLEGAKLIPLGELGNRVAELEPHRQGHVIVHCHHGGRSRRVVEALREAGFQRAQNMTGGIDAWSQEIDPEVPRY